jgi:signal transduction histidine kinase
MQLVKPMMGLVRAKAAASHRRGVPAALLAFALLLGTTLWMWQNTRAETARAAGDRFEFKTAEAQTAIAQRLLAYEQVLRGAVALFAASDAVTRDEWHTYVRTLEIERNFLGIQGIGFSAWVAPAQLAAHVAQVRAAGFPDYAIRPEGVRAEYAPIVYMEPSDWRNQRALGYDMLTEPALRATLERARDTGQPSASGKVKLAQETTDDVQSGFALCLPVFRNGAAQSTIEERRAALTGHVCSTFRMHDLLQGVLGAETLPDIQLRIFDGTTPSAATKMYDTLQGGGDGEATPSFELDKRFEFDGHQWTLRFDSLPSFEASIDAQKARFILAGGLLISTLFAAVAWSLSLNRHRARALAVANGGLQAEIAERTKLEGQLERARDLAEAANQAKSEFLANVSHELRTPLTLILAPVEQLLTAGDAPAGWAAQLARVQRNALLLMNRVNEILDFSKAQAGKFQLSPETVDLVQAIGAMAGDAAAVAERKGCTLSWHVDPALRGVYLDPSLFDKIAMNLVSNAIKFTSAGGTIELRATALADRCFEFAVQDSGIGIAADKLPLLFERFSQVDHSATRHHGGTGIGLALVKELVALMGGSAGVESEPGRGSRFFVRLPIGQAPGDSPPARAEPHPLRPRTASDAALRRLQLDDGKGPPPAPATAVRPGEERGARPCVMVVDDTPDLLAYVTELLQDECEVVTAADGELAWALLQRVPVQAIVSDVMMPNLDGLGLTARLKASAAFSHVPIILLTARGGSDASAAGLDSGADDYVAKPFSPDELKARVRAALRMEQMQAQLRDKSHQAGMAEIATNVLHNVGNVLNSVNVSAGLVTGRMQASQGAGLARAVKLMDEHAGDLADFLTRDARGKLLPSYLGHLAEALAAERQDVIAELRQLEKGIDHIKEIVTTQQSYARAAGVVEAVRVRDLVDDALRMNAVALARHDVSVVRQLDDLPLLQLDKHRLLLILVNLISNAKYAMDGVHDRPHQLTVQVQAPSPQTLRIRLVDNGEGIAPENLTRIFSHGFTTRSNGHGFGLHSCVLAAREMSGTLAAHSDGPGLGATFTLELPIKAAEGIQ